jgi:hypothetical protein
MMNFIHKHQTLFHRKLTPKTTYHVKKQFNDFPKILFLNLVVVVFVMKRNINMKCKIKNLNTILKNMKTLLKFNPRHH